MITLDDKGNITSISSYKVIETIGKGGYSFVYKVEDINKNSFALKLLYNSYNQNRINEEIKILNFLNSHKKIIPIKRVEKASSKIFFLYELSQNQNLYDEIKENGSFDEEKVYSILNDLLDVIKFSHKNSIVHKDIKAENVLLYQGKYYLMDWGISKVGNTFRTIDIKTDKNIIAPEMFKGYYDKRVDIYALGCTLYYLLTGKNVYGLNSNTESYIKMYSHLYLDIDFSEIKSKKLKYLIYRMTKKDPKKRATLDEVELILNDKIKNYSFEQNGKFNLNNNEKIKQYEEMASDNIVYAIDSYAFYKYELGHIKEAKRLYAKSVNLGYIKSMCNLAVILINEKRYDDAFLLMEKSAKNGYKKAQYYLGNMFENALGTKKDLTHAEYWYKKSSLNGYKKAYKKLAIMK